MANIQLTRVRGEKIVNKNTSMIYKRCAYMEYKEFTGVKSNEYNDFEKGVMLFDNELATEVIFISALFFDNIINYHLTKE